MAKTIKIATPLEEDFALKKDKEYSVTLKNNEDITLQIINPNGAKVSCTVKEGTGEFSLYKNGVLLVSREETYVLSKEPGLPTTIRLNTNSSLDDKTDRYIKLDKDEYYDEDSLKRSFARQYGVRGSDIEIKELKSEYKITIPDSVWELYIVATGSGKNTFKIKLLPAEK